jgi:hypothetical protein
LNNFYTKNFIQNDINFSKLFDIFSFNKQKNLSNFLIKNTNTTTNTTTNNNFDSIISLSLSSELDIMIEKKENILYYNIKQIIIYPNLITLKSKNLIHTNRFLRKYYNDDNFIRLTFKNEKNLKLNTNSERLIN